MYLFRLKRAILPRELTHATVQPQAITLQNPGVAMKNSSPSVLAGKRQKYVNIHYRSYSTYKNILSSHF